MSGRINLRPYLIRLAIVGLISVVFVVIFNEGAYLMQKDQYDRAPKTISLVIPEGAAEKVDAGENPVSIPDDMVFVLGDVLEVENQDVVAHQLGPVWVPPGTSGSVVLEQAQKLAIRCSFTTSQYLGLDVREPTTMATRLTALSFTAPTTAALLYLYSLLIFPVEPKKSRPDGKPAAANAAADQTDPAAES